MQGPRLPRAKGDRQESKYDRWKQSKGGDEGSQSPSRRRQSKRPRPRTNIPPPRTIRLNPSGSPSPSSPPPEPPPGSQGNTGNPFSDVLYKTISAFPGFREMTTAGSDPMEVWFEDNPRRRSPAYGDWAADIEVGDDWDYRPGGSDFKYQADTRARYANTNTPRDSFMRPIADPIGVVDRCCHYQAAGLCNNSH